MALVAPEVYVGDRRGAALPLAAFAAAGITAVVCLHGPARHPGSCLEYLVIHVPDAEDADLLSRLPGATAFMASAVARGGRVFVHCAGGFSRSPAVVVAYLVRYRSLCVAEALRVLRSATGHAEPNAGFMTQLAAWEAAGAGAGGPSVGTESG